MTGQLDVALVGPGAIGERHLASLRRAGAAVSVIVGKERAEAEMFAAEHGIDQWSDDLGATLTDPEIDAVVLATPTPLHARQVRACLSAGKSVLCEIPYATSLSEAQEIAAEAEAADVVAMACHTFRFARPYVHLHDVIMNGELEVRHIVATQLSRRHANIGWTGRQRDWVDDVLWHHGGHVFDSVLWFMGQPAPWVRGTVGPTWPGSGTYMDVAAVLEAPDRAVASISLTYHSRVTSSRIIVIGEEDTYELTGGILQRNGETIVDCGDWETMMRDAQAVQDRTFIAAIAEHNIHPTCGLRDVLPTMQALDRVATDSVRP